MPDTSTSAPIQRDKSLTDLADSFRLVVFEFLARLAEAGIAVAVVETLRSSAAHQQDLASGHSWVAHSKHQDGLAIDVAPYATYVLHGSRELQWAASDPVWQKIGAIGEGLGMTWGGRWKMRDMGHFEAK